MREDYDQDDRYYQLLQYLKNLLKRENLCHNTYLYKQMRNILAFPLHIIAEENTVAKITRDYYLIIDALEHTGLAHVANQKEVRLIEHPTIKINITCHEALRQIQKILQQKEKKYEISKRYDTDQYINLTVFSENILWLQKLISSLGKTIDYQRASLLQDISFGVDRIRKLKYEHARQKTAVGKINYSLLYPPEVFIRKALDSSSEEEQEMDNNGNGVDRQNHMNGNGQGNGRMNGRKKRDRLIGKHGKVRLHDQDFPSIK